MITTYYSHCIKIYNTDKEAKERSFLYESFKTIICPNRDNWPIMIISNSSEEDMKNKISPYLEYIKRDVNILVFSSINNFIDKKVYEEVKQAISLNIPCMYLDNNFKLRNIPKVKIINPNKERENYAELY